jgi:hypothetical protein
MVLDFLLELSTEAASYEDERHLHVVLKHVRIQKGEASWLM